MKRLGFLLLAVVAAFAVTACGNGKKYSMSGEEPRYSEMSTDALLDEYEQKCGELLFVMAELSDRKLSSRQERRLVQIAENLADAFGEDW